MSGLATAPPHDAVVLAEDLGVWYKGGKRTDFRSLILELLHGRRQRANRSWAVQGVSFSADSAEVLGIIGANGAGKTTICSVIAKVLRPDNGSIVVRGEVSALLSMGAGFNNELTGRENIVLNGLMLGFSRRRMVELTPEIIEFAGIERFLDTPVKHYSAGMRSRLGFSIAARLDPEILVLDEALSAGDAEFGVRASARMRELVTGARMVIVVSHSLEFVAASCDQ
ncbi:MAG: ABC transporter ATP-binding protein, partial [Spirochaetaceae bacterium]